MSMATKKKVEQEQESGSGDLLQNAAKAIGSALGTIAAKTGIAHPNTPPRKSGKLVKKDKKRLPRKEKQAKKTTEAKSRRPAKLAERPE